MAGSWLEEFLEISSCVHRQQWEDLKHTKDAMAQLRDGMHTAVACWCWEHLREQKEKNVVQFQFQEKQPRIALSTTTITKLPFTVKVPLLEPVSQASFCDLHSDVVTTLLTLSRSSPYRHHLHTYNRYSDYTICVPRIIVNNVSADPELHRKVG